jgi:hypothetical protein
VKFLRRADQNIIIIMIIIIIIIIQCLSIDRIKQHLQLIRQFPSPIRFTKLRQEKIRKRENLAMEIKNIWKLNDESVYTLVISAEEVVTKNFLKYLENMGFKVKHLKNGATNIIITNVAHNTKIPWTGPLILGSHR